MPRQSLIEAGTVTTAPTVTEAGKKSPRLQVQLITPGWGSSGYYSAEVLKAAAEAGVWPAGTQMYLDHPSVTEAEDRPERSVKDLAAVLASPGRWNGQAVVAEAEPAGPGRTYATDKAFLDAVGVSIRAAAEVELGEAEGRKGWIVKELFAETFNSVDFVTHAGRGGLILELVESARHAHDRETRVSEATANDTREALNAALKDEYGADKTWIWVRDFDQSTVWFEVETEDSTGVYAQGYSLDDNGSAALAGDRTEVRVRTQYVPVDAEEAHRPDLTRKAALTAVREARNVGQWMESRIHLGFTQVADEMFGNGKLTREERIALSSGIGDALAAFTGSVEKAAPQLYQRDLWTDPDARVAAAEAHTPNVPVHPAGPSKTTRENTMPEIEETRLRQLEEASGRVPTLESERDAATQRAATAEQSLAVEQAKSYARDFGTARVREANSELDAAVVERIVAEAMREIPLGDDQRLDTDAFGERVDVSRKAEETYLASIASTVGRVRGVGESQTTPTVTEAQVDNVVGGAFGRKTVKGA